MKNFFREQTYVRRNEEIWVERNQAKADFFPPLFFKRVICFGGNCIMLRTKDQKVEEGELT
jgi:hypothetical protein